MNKLYIAYERAHKRAGPIHTAKAGGELAAEAITTEPPRRVVTRDDDLIALPNFGIQDLMLGRASRRVLESPRYP